MFEKIKFWHIQKKLWDFADYKSLTVKDNEDDHYIAPVLYEKMRKRSKDIFKYLRKDLKKINDPHALRGKYEFLMNIFWEDLSFLVHGVRQYDEECGRIYGFRIPKWVIKDLTEDKIKDVKESCVNMLTWGEPRREMIYYLNHILSKKYNNPFDYDVF